MQDRLGTERRRVQRLRARFAGLLVARQTEDEALANIQEAIREYLAVREELLRGTLVREVDVAWPGCQRTRAAATRQRPRALQKAGFRIARQGKHSVMTDGVRILTITATTRSMRSRWAVIVRDAGLTVEEFRTLLSLWRRTARFHGGGSASHQPPALAYLAAGAMPQTTTVRP